jgi:hypothetical protein
MKLDLLKKLIKEAVSEAVREELSKILSEDAKPAPTPIGVGGYGVPNTVTKYASHRPVVARPIPTGDPIMDLMNETKYSMTQGEYQNLVSATSDMVSAPGMGMQSAMDQFRPGPEPGLDISQFDFMMRAGDVYKASVAKDKQRFGG